MTEPNQDGSHNPPQPIPKPEGLTTNQKILVLVGLAIAIGAAIILLAH